MLFICDLFRNYLDEVFLLLLHFVVVHQVYCKRVQPTLEAVDDDLKGVLNI